MPPPGRRVRSKRGSGPSRSQQRGGRGGRDRQQQGQREQRQEQQQRQQQQREKQQRQQQEQRQQQSQREQRQEQQQRQQQQREKQQREERASAREQARTRPTRTTQRKTTKTTVGKRQEDKQGILAAIGHGPVQEGYIGDEAFKKTQAAGQHKLRSQFDRLSAKYGPGFADTSQGKLLRDYLSGVPVERGGGLGAKDPTYGGGAIPTGPGEAYRQQLLTQIESSLAAGGRPSFSGINDDLARQGLSPDQYFNFRQQLMAADPSAGNVAYKEAFPFASGQLTQGLASLAPGIGTLGRIAGSAFGNLIPEDAKTMGKNLRTKIGDVTGRPFAGFGQGLKNLFQTTPPPEAYGNIGRTFAGSPSVRPDGDRGGVIDAAQSVVDQASPYGAGIGQTGPVTGGIVDSDGDGVDDRYQTGPGQPNQGPGQGGFEVGDVTQPATIVPQQSPFASSYQPFNFPIGGGQDPNLQDWYKNLGIMQNVNR